MLKRVMILMICSMGMSACEKQIIDIADEDIVPSKVFFVVDDVDSYQVRQIDFLDVGDTSGEFTLALYKSGVLKDPVSVRIGELTESELADYNARNGQDFVLLTPETYTLSQREFTFTGGYDDLSKTVDITFDLDRLREADARAVLPLTIRQSSAEINGEKSLVILKPQVQDVVIAFADGNRDVVYSDNGSLQRDIRVSFDALLGLAENDWDIDVDLQIDESYVEEYNQRESASYRLLSPDQYSLQMQGTIEPGQTSVSFLLEIGREQISEPGQYMLPIRLKSSSRFTVDESSLYCVRIDVWSGELLDRTDWEVVLYNTYEPAESGSDNSYFPYGYPEAILDGDLNSYWHSQWKPSVVPPPHYLVIDMQEEHLVEQVELIQRNKYFACKDIELYMGNDLAPLEALATITDVAEMQGALAGIPSWKKIATEQMKEEAAPQIFNVSLTSGRYLMVLITSSYRSNLITSLSEVYVYGQ